VEPIVLEKYTASILRTHGYMDILVAYISQIKVPAFQTVQVHNPEYYGM
jgi:hypothetical protein